MATHANVVAPLQGPEWRSKYICIFALILPQLWLSVYVPRVESIVWRLLLWYGVGCTLTQALFLAIHELSHNLFFRHPTHNRWFSCVVNLPLGVPFAIAFRTYHMRHHTSQGRIGVDGDLPTEWECRLLRSHWSLRIAWLSLQIVAYALRPLLCTDAISIATPGLALNWIVQISFNALWIHRFGWPSYVYMLCCVVGAGSLHPCAGHFISEHYGWGGGTTTQETFSYYGPLNRLTWNVGYHNEHHDFPLVPWSRLPTLSKRLSQHYETLETCPSWPGCLIRFVGSSTGSYRIVRDR